jgi:glucuronoarabinoxylan endo-1,4-beta-xylanase
MKRFHQKIVVALGMSVPLLAATQSFAQTATVTVTSQKQTIRGIGGMSHAAWAGDLTAAERTLAFGNADGQLGFSALRIPVSDGTPDSSNVATAKAAIAAGAIVFATPWNAAGAMSSSDFATYATHLNDFVTYMKGQGVDLYAIGTQNEPDYGSQGGWRTWTAAQCHDFALNYGATISTKLISCESFSYNKSYYDPILNDSAALANVGVLGTHLYGTSVSSYPYPLCDTKGAGKERWMTEHYTDSTTDANSWPNALGVATELHHAMVDGQFSLYTWWYIVRSYGPITASGTVSKRGSCMAQFSKFIRPGFVRVDATANPTSNIYVSAYTNNGEVVIVIVNNSASAGSLTVSVPGVSISSYTKYTTSSSKNVSNDGAVTAQNGTLTVALDAESVTTLDGTGKATGTGGSPDAGGTTDGGSSGSDGSSGAGSSSSSSGSSGVGSSSGSGSSSGTRGSSSSSSSSGVGGSSGVGSSSGTSGSSGTGGSTSGSPGAGGDGGSEVGIPDSGGAGTTASSSGSSAVAGSSSSSGGGATSTGASSGSGGGSGGIQGGGASSSSGGNTDTGGSSAAPGDSSSSGCSYAVGSRSSRSVPETATLLLGALGIVIRRQRRARRR